jgi:cellulose synthase/poly-beta-1,6-N-acetylglucosamine synthase-like glycosyltransferase
MGQMFLDNFISVIIPVYNGEKDLRPMADCLRRQDYPFERFECLFIDNKSTDKSREVLSEICAKMVSEGVSSACLFEENIQSAAAARNRGIRASKGDILVFVDVDCRPEPGWLRHLMEPFESPNVLIVAGMIVPLPGKSFIERYTLYKGILSQEGTLTHASYKLPYAQTANLAIRRFVLQKVGLFRPYVTSGEDADLCWRIINEFKCGIFYQKTATVKHKARSDLKGLIRQARSYGLGEAYLERIYGTLPGGTSSGIYCIRHFLSWMLKKAPIQLLKMCIGKGNMASLMCDPLDIIFAYERIKARRDAVLMDGFEIIPEL